MISTITDLRHAIQHHVAHTKGGVGKRWNPNIVTNIWNKLLHDRRMPKRSMTKKRSSLRGGAAYELAGAPLDYAMTPGSAFTTNPAVAVYDRFPIDPTVNPQVVSDLDVFFGSALTRGCGVENSSLQVPADMGSNQVGGKRRKTHHRKYRGGNASSMAEPKFLDTIGNGMGDLATTIGFHPYMNSSIPSTPHSLTSQWQGKMDTIPASSDPTDHTWTYATDLKPDSVSINQFATALGPTSSLFQKQVGAGRKASRKGRKASRKSRKGRKSRKSNRKH
jgi:hypothetical protein